MQDRCPLSTSFGPGKILRYFVNMCSLGVNPAVVFWRSLFHASGGEPLASRRGERNLAGLALSVHPGRSQTLSEKLWGETGSTSGEVPAAWPP